MILSRIDLCDLRSPEMIARSVLKQIPDLVPPVPVVSIAEALDIHDVRIQDFDGFEGMLLTDRVRRKGSILANARYGANRARFTIAHELGHFLMEWHELSAVDGFCCRTSDMQVTREDRRDLRQEAQANRFAIELLAPRDLVDPHLSNVPELRDAQKMQDRLQISLEAAVRRLINRRDEPLAALFSKHGQIRYVIREAGFPWIKLKNGDALPRMTAAFRAVSAGQPGYTEMAETLAAAWTSRPDADLWEQTRVGKNGTAITLLEAGASEPEDEPAEDLAELDMPRFR